MDAGLPDFCFSRRPMSQSSCWPLGPIGPAVSTAMGVNRVPAWRLEYVDIFPFSASAATAPGSALAKDTWLAANVSGQVKSQVSNHPDFQGTSVALSGLPLLERQRPLGSRREGTPAEVRPRLMTLLAAPCLVRGPWLFLQLKPCVPSSSAALPQC